MFHPIAGRMHYVAAQVGERGFAVELDLETQNAFLGAAANGQHAMGGNLGDRLAVVGVHLELAFGIFDAGDGVTHHAAALEHHLSHALADFGVLVDALGQDVARAFERFLDGGDAFLLAQERGGQFGQRQFGGRLIPEVVGERLEAFFARDGGLGAALGLVGQVQVLEFVLFENRLDARAQLRGELALLVDGLAARWSGDLRVRGSRPASPRCCGSAPRPDFR